MLGVFDLFLLLFLFISSVLSFVVIYAAYPNFVKNIMSIVNNTSEIVSSISNIMAKIVLYLPIAIAIMVESRVDSIVFLGKVAPRNYKARKVTFIVFMIIS